MRKALFFVCTSAALSIAVACATSNDEAPRRQEEDSGPTPISDGGVPESEPPLDATDPIGSSCSDAGWCATTLPDSDLTLKDIWPHDNRAFAIAESATLGVKILEWDSAKSWRYIDDNTQNAYGDGTYAGNLWSPSENEIYFGVSSALIYHGKRPSVTEPWSWEHVRLPDNSKDSPERDHGRAPYAGGRDRPVLYSSAIGVWGTSADNVYAWYANTVFHWKSEDGGPPAWVAEYIAEDPANPADTFFIFNATGSSPDDIWFAAGRGRFDATGIFACSVVIQRTPDSYRRVVDHRIGTSDAFGHQNNVCLAKAGFLQYKAILEIPGYGTFVIPRTRAGWAPSIQSAAPNVTVAMMPKGELTYVDAADGGSALYNSIIVQTTRGEGDIPSLMNSVWIHDSEAWMSGWGIVLRADKDLDRWSRGAGMLTETQAQREKLDASVYSVSTTVINGAPLDRPIYQVRGTSNTNLWAIGARHALHKTTP